ncbi:PRD domain-containing protein [Latilactobacillus graminis]|uniref:Transcription antiterminator n=2 Tax=Latilactobacillus graminis TaxID=60519 RepID=A0AA89KXS1_9LACO|nr:PRD domain-containing protein [Latilactobacillus graminis]KRM23650.1 transcription antiterminator [Latilactobacillus graminis DSM 20719]QFP80160.1 PRD domain-containing protein [Latilactobacillus graminis]
MKFQKNFNNNAALVEDEQALEWIVIGNGVGFGKHLGDLIDETKIERRFIATGPKGFDTTQIQALTTINAKLLAIMAEMVTLVESALNTQITDHQYLILADHLQFAIKRTDAQAMLTDQSLFWELRSLFPTEYQVAQRIIQLINQKLALQLPDDETVPLTYHLVNIKNGDSAIEDTMIMTKLVANIISIVQKNYGIILDETSFNASRFISHLRYFIIRRLKQSPAVNAQLDPELLAMMITRYPQAYHVVQQITTFLNHERAWVLQPDEAVYLLLHIWRVTHYQQSE